jgi:hypothetical protein
MFGDIGRNCLLGKRKKIAKFLMRTFTYRSPLWFSSYVARWMCISTRQQQQQPVQQLARPLESHGSSLSATPSKVSIHCSKCIAEFRSMARNVDGMKMHREENSGDNLFRTICRNCSKVVKNWKNLPGSELMSYRTITNITNY